MAEFDDEKIERLDRLAERLENVGLEDYVRLSRNPNRLLWLNFISGIARGLGFTLGTALVLAILYKVLARLISMNIPYLTEILIDFVEMIKGIH